MKLRWLFVPMFALLLTPVVRADVTVAKVFGDHMVLQREMKVPVWGKAAPNEEVTVTFMEQKKTTKADDKGNWSVKLDELKAGGPFTLTVAGKNTVTFKDVLVGEVWLCSGQSNMQWTMKQLDKEGKNCADANHPQLRLNGGSWQVCDPKTAHNFSATAYYFGVNLQKKLGVPVGLINRSVGGTSARLWISKSAVENAAELKPFHKVLLENPKLKVGGLYEGLIRPLIPCAIRGTIWYQGESDAGTSAEYTHLFRALIKSWRADFGQGDFPFLFVQLGAIGGPPKTPAEVGWGPIREAQANALTLPNTAVAAYHDSHADIHPKNKEVIGARLALAARKVAYNEDLVYSGPTFDGLKIDGNKAIVSFKNIGGGMLSKGDKLKGFAIAGNDGNFVFAEAKIDGNTVIVTSEKVPNPVHVRYGFASNPQCTLYNREDLPAVPFRTDRPKE